MMTLGKGDEQLGTSCESGALLPTLLPQVIHDGWEVTAGSGLVAKIVRSSQTRFR
jgi:hypothetical protein